MRINDGSGGRIPGSGSRWYSCHAVASVRPYRTPNARCRGAVPLPARVMPLVFEAHRDSIVGEAPELFHQTIVQLLLPLALEERFDRFAALEEFCAIPPGGILGISTRHKCRIAAIPFLLSRFDFGGSGFRA